MAGELMEQTGPGEINELNARSSLEQLLTLVQSMGFEPERKKTEKGTATGRVNRGELLACSLQTRAICKCVLVSYKRCRHSKTQNYCTVQLFSCQFMRHIFELLGRINLIPTVRWLGMINIIPYGKVARDTI